MKILLPFKVHDDKSIFDKKVMGGLERFAQLLLKNCNHEIIPVLITKNDRKSGKTAELLRYKATTLEVDVILSNYEDEPYTTKLLSLGIPVVWIYHSPQDGTFGRVKAVKLFKKFTDLGGHLYFVSEQQHSVFNTLSSRILGHPVEKVIGYINPSFSEGYESVYTGESEFDVVTIGRTSYLKDPFWVHRLLKDSTLKSAVITTGGHHLASPKEKKYYEDNLDWSDPRLVFRDLSHIDGLNLMSHGKVFISTCPLETWGISTLESLSYGLPTILLSDKTGKHSSETIAADISHIRVLPKTIKSDILEDNIRDLMTYSYDKRLEISNMTKQKHSKEAFVNQFDKMFCHVKGIKKDDVFQPHLFSFN